MIASIQDERVRALTRRLDPDRLPRRVAMIWSGAGSWARAQGASTQAAHVKTARNAAEVVRTSLELGRIESVTLCACRECTRASTPTRTKPSYLAAPFLKRYGEGFVQHGVRFHFLGALDELAPAERELCRTWERHGPRNPRLSVTLAVNYSGRREILDVTRAVAREVRLGKLPPASVNEEFVGARIRAGQPELDLLIRTNGEMTPGDFLLWDLSYAELVSAPEKGPDFGAAGFLNALLEYQSRQRRFGAR